MLTDLIKTIKEVALNIIKQHEVQIQFGTVEKVDPLTVKIGKNRTLTKEFLVLDSQVDVGENVIILKYSTGNKYLVLSTVEKVYKTTIPTGGTDGTEYPTDGQWKSLGTFTVTHYCCENFPHICNDGDASTTATGTKPHVGGCAVDPKVIPLGSYVKMNGVVYHAEDTGGAIKGNRIDIVVPTHNEALQRGLYTAEVFLKVGD